MFKKIKKFFKSAKNMADIDEKSTIGYKTYIGKYSTINDSTIGKFCSIGENVKIGLYNHYMYAVTTHPFVCSKNFGIAEYNYYNEDIRNSVRKPVVIGNDVWIGTNVVVLRGVTVGDGAVIGAGAIVTKDIPPYAIAVGNPANVIKYRFTDEQIDKMIKIKWWNWDIVKIKENIKDFYDVELFISKFYN